MRNKRILNALGQIDDDYIAEAMPKNKTVKRNVWIKWVGFAACLGLILYTAIKMIPVSPIDPVPGQYNLPMLTLEQNIDGMGFEGYWAYDISEIVNNNPWNEASKISALPVYKNRVTFSEKFEYSAPDVDQMKGVLRNVGKRMGMDVDNLEITDNRPTEALETGEKAQEDYFTSYIIMIEENGIQLEVDQHLTATIRFEPSISLPEEYNFVHFASYVQVASVATYLKETYKDLIGMENPSVNIDGGDYSIITSEDQGNSSEKPVQGYQIGFYDNSGEDTEKIINYNFNRVAFYPDDEGKLDLARVFQPDLSDKVADYPIISADDAKVLLENGNYITTVPEKFPGSKLISKVELIYRTGDFDKYFMPFYRFYVEMPDMEREDGLKTYGAYYVPAVEGKHISNMPVWDGSFN